MPSINAFDKTFFMNGTEGAILLTICIAAAVCTIAVIALAVVVIVTIKRRGREDNGEVLIPAEEEPTENAAAKPEEVLYETPEESPAEAPADVPTATSAKKLKIARGEAYVEVRYDKSFTAKLIQSDDELKGWYSSLKNALLGYKKVTSRISWRTDSINRGRIKLAKFAIRGKTLSLYLALNPDDYADTKYKVERAENKRFEEVPCLYRIKNARRAKYALELIAVLAEKFELQPIEREQVDYCLPYEETERLLERGLVKEIVYKPDAVKDEEDGEAIEEAAPAEIVGEAEEIEELSKPSEEEAEEIPVEEAEEVPAEIPVEEVFEQSAEEPAEEPIVKTQVEELSAKEISDVESYEEEAKDDDGIEVVGVMFRRRGRKVYWFDPDGKTWTKGEIALYISSANPPQEVIVVDNAKISPDKLHLPLKPLHKA